MVSEQIWGKKEDLCRNGKRKPRVLNQFNLFSLFSITFEFLKFPEMVAAGLRDQDKLDGASNFGVWKSIMTFLLDVFGLREYANIIINVSGYPQPLTTYKMENVKVKRIILDGVNVRVQP